MAFLWLINGGYYPLTNWDDPPRRGPIFVYIYICITIHDIGGLGSSNYLLGGMILQVLRELPPGTSQRRLSGGQNGGFHGPR